MNTKNFMFAVTALFAFIATHAQPVVMVKKKLSKTEDKAASTFFNGAWTSDGNKGYSVMYNGYFNSVAEDSAGKWSEVHAGTYTVNGDNTITFKVLYSSFPDHVGASNTAEYTISGETVKMRHFKKLIDAQGKDMTDQMPKNAWETITRAQ